VLSEGKKSQGKKGQGCSKFGTLGPPCAIGWTQGGRARCFPVHVRDGYTRAFSFAGSTLLRKKGYAKKVLDPVSPVGRNLSLSLSLSLDGA